MTTILSFNYLNKQKDFIFLFKDLILEKFDAPSGLPSMNQPVRQMEPPPKSVPPIQVEDVEIQTEFVDFQSNEKELTRLVKLLQVIPVINPISLLLYTTYFCFLMLDLSVDILRRSLAQIVLLLNRQQIHK